jgi:hypothetical protein
MNWRTSIAASMAASWLAVALVGAAEPAAQKAEAKPAAAATATADKDKTKASDEKKKEQKCATTTGSRIRRDPPVDCDSAPGLRSYTADDINSTGEMDVSDALRKLDPRLQ